MLTRDFENTFCSTLMGMEGDESRATDYILSQYASHQDCADQIRALVHEVSFFFDEPQTEALQQLFLEADRKGQFVAQIMADTGGNPEGVELSNERGQYALILKDASHPGMVRYQCFDDNGFMSHHTEPDWEKALEDAWFSGFKVRVTGILDELSSQPAFFESTNRSRLACSR